MADWVHCNTCFGQPFEIKAQFHLTNCGHIFCENCTKQGYCQVCKQKCSSILLTNKMKPDVEKFFTPPKEILKQLMQVLDFQDGHRQRIVKHRMSKSASEKHSQGREATAQGFRELQKEYQKIRDENHRLKQALLAIKSQQTDVMMQSRSSTPHSQVMQSPLRKSSGIPMSQEQRIAGTTPASMQHGPSAMQHGSSMGNNAGVILSQGKARTPSDRISIRTPPVGGVISTPSPCKIYKVNNTGGYPRPPHSSRSMTQNSPAGSQMRSRSNTPTMSISRSITPSRYNSPRDPSTLMSSSQYSQNKDTTPMATYSNKTPYTSRPESSTPMEINSTLDPAQRQIRLTYQPRTALMAKGQPRSSQQTA